MLQIPPPDDTGYEELLLEAVHKIPMLTDEWTDFNRHDPGITTLEIFAWLTDMLNYYVDAVGKVHLLKYKKLMGIEELEPRAAKAFLCLLPQETQEEEILCIPKGFPLYAGEKSFLVKESVQLSCNRFQTLLYQTGGKIVNMTAFAGKDGSYARVFQVRDAEPSKECLYFGFEKPLKGEVRLFITVKENHRRGAIPRGFSLSALGFCVYTNKGWCRAELLMDGTNGFLQSGTIILKTGEATKLYYEDGIAPGHYLKVELLEHHYDVMPEIGSCFLNPVEVVQKEEYFTSLFVTAKKDETSYLIPHYISGREHIAVGLWDEQKEAFRIIFSEEPDSLNECRVDIKEKRLYFEAPFLPREGTEIEIFLMKEEFLTLREVGITDGCACQELALPLEVPYELELILETRIDGKCYYTHWSQVRDLKKADWGDCVFVLDRQKNSIRFGDGIHGRIPHRGCRVKIGSYSRSDYDGGNVREGEIREIHDMSYGRFTAFNAAGATGGRAEDSFKSMEKRFEEKVLEQRRIVSLGDFETMIRQIPGLMIRGVKVVAAAEYCSSHGLTRKPYDTYLVVCPVAMKPGQQLSGRYREYISDYLEKYRMLNTRVKVVPPSYGSINISGALRITTGFGRAKSEVELNLREYVEKRERDCEFGAVISYGDIFVLLENLQWVERVEELHLSVGGNMGRRTLRGDIQLNSDCLPCIGDMIFEYKESRDWNEK